MTKNRDNFYCKIYKFTIFSYIMDQFSSSTSFQTSSPWNNHPPSNP
uniref:Uncharacterized protein n=1 Tax=Arundo donax TaxID=35708 RepID=A0A0A8ZK43_ARUDO